MLILTSLGWDSSSLLHVVWQVPVWQPRLFHMASREVSKRAIGSMRGLLGSIYNRNVFSTLLPSRRKEDFFPQLVTAQPMGDCRNPTDKKPLYFRLPVSSHEHFLLWPILFPIFLYKCKLLPFFIWIWLWSAIIFISQIAILLVVTE